jgi:uncharacterized protein YggE
MHPAYSDWMCGERSFSVTADICINVPPDGWIIELQGSEEQTTLALASTKIQARIDALTKKLNAKGIPSTDIVVSTVSQERVRENKQNAKGQWVSVVTGYTLTKKIQIKYPEMSQYAGIVTDASTQLFDQVLSNYCTVADEQAVYAELYRQAMEVVLQKEDEDVNYYGASIVPGGKVSNEHYDVNLPDPTNDQQPGSQRSVITGYDRILSPEYGDSAVKYFIHLEYTFSLEKKPANIKPKPKTK